MSTLKTSNLQHASAASANITLASDGTTTIAAPSNIIKSGTAVASTSGTSIDFTGIPSWVKRITLMFDGVSTNGTSLPQIQLGDSGGIETTSYTGATSLVSTVAITTNHSSAFLLNVTGEGSAVRLVHGAVTLSLLSSNTWAASGAISQSTSTVSWVVSGTKTLSATLDRVRITTVNGTDTFDAGTINILYEG